MKFTLDWLKDYLETGASLSEIESKLTAIGLEVEEVTDRSAELSEFKIAQILEAKPHPDANKLQICTVDTGNEKLQIVCGAKNARAGINVVLAPIGSIIPTNQMKIKKSKIRGVESNGMLCSAAELGIGEDSAGIIEMPASSQNLGKNYAGHIGLDDPIIEIAITPNRGDCLGVYGIARDLAAAGLGKLKELKIEEVTSSFDSPLSVEIEEGSKNNCPMFVGRYFKSVKNAESPAWLKDRLESIGVKSISALVDITNYISFAFGRPLHVYDANKISGNLKIRKANNGEKITALNENKYLLDEEVTVVADKDNAQAIGGIIGGLSSGCDENTEEVFLEVALFDANSVAKTGRKLDIITDSRYRFERNVDPAFLMDAANIASKMIIDLCGGSASNFVICGSEPKWQKEIDFDFGQVKSLGGIDVSQDEGANILRSLGFKVKENKISVPSWRSDVTIEADLVEEIVRIHGYDNIPTNEMPASNSDFNDVLSNSQKRIFNIRKNMASIGMTEVITWSFMKEDVAELFGGKGIKLQNPISNDLKAMRPSILPNLVDTVKRNVGRGAENLALFEIGLVFYGTDRSGQKQSVATIRSGQNHSKNIYNDSRNVDVFDAKSDCLYALEMAGAPVSNLRVDRDAPQYYHPGRSGSLKLGKEVLAYFGEVHPAILKKMDVKTPIVGSEVFCDNLPQAKNKKSKSRSKLTISEYQSSTRDFAFVVSASVDAEQILKAAKNCEKSLIQDVSLFDVYQGEHLEEGKKSLAISISIQASDRTLTEKELDSVSDKVIAAVGKLGGVLRA